eukprot:scaffold1181_cov387-Prasinococcus_capsulatus_cf.AAC.11
MLAFVELRACTHGFTYYSQLTLTYTAVACARPGFDELLGRHLGSYYEGRCRGREGLMTLGCSRIDAAPYTCTCELRASCHSDRGAADQSGLSARHASAS